MEKEYTIKLSEADFYLLLDAFNKMEQWGLSEDEDRELRQKIEEAEYEV